MGLSTGGWIYKDVELPKKYVLGEEGKGFYVNMDGFNAARVLVAAACLGGAEKGLEISGEYTAQRKTFGKPLVKWEGISFEMADDWMQLDMLKLNLLRGAWMIGQEHTEPGSVRPQGDQQGHLHLQVPEPDARPRHRPSRDDVPRRLRLHEGDPARDAAPRRHDLRGRRRGRPR